MERAVLKVDLRRVADNFVALRRKLGHDVCAVVKADAYGLGAVAVATALEQAGCGWFAVATADEAADLRDAGIGGRILLLGPAAMYTHEFVRRHGLTVWVASLDDLRWLGELPADARFHVKVDTGMNRLGLPPAEARSVVLRHAGRVEAVATHFACADAPGHPMNVEQRQRLADFVEALPKAPPLIHASNTALALTGAPQVETMARIGLGLYGIDPTGIGVPKLDNAVGLSSRIVAVRDVLAGQTVSYGAEFRAERRTRVGVVGIGYADGVPVSLSGKGVTVRCRGGDAPVIGRITMDICMIDLTDLPGVSVGDEVTLLDPQRSDAAMGWARLSGRLPYEILIGLGNRAKREYAR